MVQARSHRCWPAAGDDFQQAAIFPAPASEWDLDLGLSSHVGPPRKFDAEDEFRGDEPPVTFYLFVMNDKAKKRALDELLGRLISVVLDGFFCSETAWHVGDAVVFKWQLPER